MMKITINGEAREFQASDLSLEELVQALGLEPKMLLVEHNGRALARTEWGDCVVRNGDALEILRIAAGG